MKFACALATAVTLGLTGCATPTAHVPAAESFFVDAAFKPPTVTIDRDDALALSPEMLRFAQEKMRPEMRIKGVREGLIDALYTSGVLKLDYDSTGTRSAAEAFRDRRGNCMSLVLLTAAFARHFDQPVTFNSVILEEQWTRASGLYLVAGHVNVTLTRVVPPMGRVAFTDDDNMTVDFLPAEMVRGQRRRVIDESTILAMYMNNRAAEALGVGQTDDAYWWARAAILSDPRWLSGYNTLGVLYRRKGLQDQAEAALRFVLDREPLNTQAMSNLILVLNDQGRRDEALAYRTQLAQVQPAPPYKYFDEGVAAMQAGQYAAARELFSKEVSRASYVPEFHFWLALANYAVGDVSAARGEIAKAMENSATVRDRELYGAKLAWLNQQRRLMR